MTGRMLMIVGAALLLAVGAAVAASSFGGSGATTATVKRLNVPDLPEPPQSDLGPPPDLVGAAGLDLSQPSELVGFDLRGPAAGLAFDFADGRVLWQRNAMVKHPIASLTKMMTGLLAVERLGPDDRVKITHAVDNVPPSRMAGLKAGRRVKAEVLLKGLLISSSNNAAVALAIGAAGSEHEWVRLMNKRAKLLHLTCTHYVDPHGLGLGDHSCAADLAVIAMRAMAVPRIAAIAHKRFARVWPGGGKKQTIFTTNHLLREHYPGAIGLKTGYTVPAGLCLVAVIQRGSKRIGIVLLHDKDPWGSAKQLTRAAVRAGILPAR
jgi:serine-type D-Ala-D-Ala carboxypeptidase (penicillin-binding protein 5/6)